MLEMSRFFGTPLHLCKIYKGFPVFLVDRHKYPCAVQVYNQLCYHKWWEDMGLCIHLIYMSCPMGSHDQCDIVLGRIKKSLSAVVHTSQDLNNTYIQNIPGEGCHPNFQDNGTLECGLMSCKLHFSHMGLMCMDLCSYCQCMLWCWNIHHRVGIHLLWLKKLKGGVEVSTSWRVCTFLHSTLNLLWTQRL